MSYEDQGDQNYEGQYEPQYEENFLPGEQEEVSVNIPGGEEYPECDDVGLTEDAIRIVQDFVLSNGHLQLTAEQVAEVMRDVDGNEREESLYYARMVLDVWRMHNPHLEGLEDECPREEAPEPVQREEYYEEQYEGVVEEVEEVVEEVGAAEERKFTAQPEPAYVAALPPSHTVPEPEPVVQYVVESKAVPEVVAAEPKVVPKQQGDGYSSFGFKVPLPDEYPFYNEMVDFASRLLENFVIANGNLKIAHHELGKSLLEPDGKLTVKAVDLADMVLEVWHQQNPQLEVSRRTAAYELASEEGQVVVTVPADSDFPLPDHLGLRSNAIRVVRNFALQTGTLALTVDDVQSSITESAGDQWADTRTVAAAVLEEFRKRNPHMPGVSVPPPTQEAQVGVIQRELPTPATISLPGGATLVIPLESDYPAFDRSGLTDDAIRIIREFVTDTGSLGITPELVAAQMVDFMGNTSPESLSIAASVLAVWRSRNPLLPLTSVKEIYPGVIEPEKHTVTSTLPIASSAPETKTQNTVHGATGQELVHVGTDSRDLACEAELAKLLERLDCEVESFWSPTFGPGVRIKTLSSHGTLYRSGVEPGDAIVTMDNLQVTKVSQLYTLLSRVAIGAKFTWRLRRCSVTGNVTEWCVTLSIPDRPKKAIEPRFAGMPGAVPYQSHSGLLPNDPGFARRYAEVPGSLIPPPPHVPTHQVGGTRIIQGTAVIPAGVTVLSDPQPAPPALVAPVSVSTPARIPFDVDYASGTRTIPAPPLALAAPVSVAPARISLDVDYAAGTRTVYPLEGPPYTIPITVPYTASASTVQHSTAVHAINSPPLVTEVISAAPQAVYPVASTVTSLSHVAAPRVLSTVSAVGARTHFSRREVVPASWVDIENIKERMLRQYEASINRTVSVTEERIPVSTFLKEPSVLRSPRVTCPPVVVPCAPAVPHPQPPVLRWVAPPPCQPCSPARSVYSYL